VVRTALRPDYSVGYVNGRNISSEIQNRRPPIFVNEGTEADQKRTHDKDRYNLLTGRIDGVRDNFSSRRSKTDQKIDEYDNLLQPSANQSWEIFFADKIGVADQAIGCFVTSKKVHDSIPTNTMSVGGIPSSLFCQRSQ
jgi:hypothetical protein